MSFTSGTGSFKFSGVIHSQGVSYRIRSCVPADVSTSVNVYNASLGFVLAFHVGRDGAGRNRKQKVLLATVHGPAFESNFARIEEQFSNTLETNKGAAVLVQQNS